MIKVLVQIKIPKMLRKVPIIVVTLAAFLAAANYLPLFLSTTDQESCTFGSVSNSQYRAYFLEAKNRHHNEWPPLDGGATEVGKQLDFRVSDMVRNKNIYERIAITHAVLRAVGAQYLNTNGRTDLDPYVGAESRRQDVEFNYVVDVNHFRLQPYPRKLWIVARIVNPEFKRRPSEREKREEITAAFVSIFDHPPDQFLVASGEQCPPSPSTDIAARYDNQQK